MPSPLIRRTAVPIAALVLATLAVAPVSAAPPTGNAAAIALETSAASLFNSQSYHDSVTSHDYFLGANPAGGWSLTWNYPSTPETYEGPANDTSVQEISHGKYLRYTDVFSNRCHTTADKCGRGEPPVEFYFFKNSSGDHAFWGYVSGSGPSCWNPAKGPTAWIKSDFNYIGQPGWYVGSAPGTTTPNYEPVAKSNGESVVTSTYSYTSDHQGVTEVDDITSAKAFTKSTYQVGAGTNANDKAYHYTVTYTVPTTAPTWPVVNMCS